jgi:hypothetical protein
MGAGSNQNIENLICFLTISFPRPVFSDMVTRFFCFMRLMAELMVCLEQPASFMMVLRVSGSPLS